MALRPRSDKTERFASVTALVVTDAESEVSILVRCPPRCTTKGMEPCFLLEVNAGDV